MNVWKNMKFYDLIVEFNPWNPHIDEFLIRF